MTTITRVEPRRRSRQRHPQPALVLEISLVHQNSRFNSRKSALCFALTRRARRTYKSQPARSVDTSPLADTRRSRSLDLADRTPARTDPPCSPQGFATRTLPVRWRRRTCPRGTDSRSSTMANKTPPGRLESARVPRALRTSPSMDSHTASCASSMGHSGRRRASLVMRTRRTRGLECARRAPWAWRRRGAAPGRRRERTSRLKPRISVSKRHGNDEDDRSRTMRRTSREAHTRTRR